MTPEEAAADMKRTAASVLDEQAAEEERKKAREALVRTAPSPATAAPAPAAPAQAQESTYFDADAGKLVKGAIPEDMEEVGIRGSGANAVPIYAKKTVDYTIPRRNAIARNMERQRFLERARRTPGGADMVRRQDRQQTAQQAAEARATPEAVEKELYGGADANYAAMGRGASADERRTLTTMQMRDRLRRQKAIRDEVARRRTRARLIGEIGPE